MARAPEAGWYADPQDVGRHRYWDGAAWTDKTRLASGPGSTARVSRQRGRSDLILGLAIGAIALVVIGVALIVVLASRGSSPEATTTPSATPSATATAAAPRATPTTQPSDVIVPEGWTLFTSPTGVLSYAVEPTWTNLIDDTSQDLVHSIYADVPGVTSEYSGGWMVSGSAQTQESDIYIIAVSDGTDTADLQQEAVTWAGDQVDSPVATVDAPFNSGHGYDAWRYVYTGTYENVFYFETVVVLRAGTTLVYVYGTSTEGYDKFSTELQTLADSIVVHHPPLEH